MTARWFATGAMAVAVALGTLAGTAPATQPAFAEVARQATPAPATPAPAQPPAADPAATPAPPADTADAAAAQPAAEPTPAPAVTPAATTDVVSLVAWYVNDPTGEFINILPVAVDPSLVATEQPGAAVVGRADFPEDGPPTVTLGETTFTAYPRTEGDIPERWTWFDDFEGARPATLVMQVAGEGGPYAGYFGTATFVSRDEGGVGGVIVLALRPPGSAAEGEATPAQEAPADGEAPAAEPAA